jgi:hypothetical protein
MVGVLKGSLGALASMIDKQGKSSQPKSKIIKVIPKMINGTPYAIHPFICHLTKGLVRITGQSFYFCPRK